MLAVAIQQLDDGEKTLGLARAPHQPDYRICANGYEMDVANIGKSSSRQGSSSRKSTYRGQKTTSAMHQLGTNQNLLADESDSSANHGLVHMFNFKPSDDALDLVQIIAPGHHVEIRCNSCALFDLLRTNGYSIQNAA